MSTGTPIEPAELAMIKALWDEGHSYSQIARQINEAFGTDRTRSGIAGVCFRNGWRNCPNPKIPTPRRKKGEGPQTKPAASRPRFWTPEIIAAAIELRDQRISRNAAHAVLKARFPGMVNVRNFYNAMNRYKVVWPAMVTERPKVDKPKSAKPRAPWVEPVYEYDAARVPVALTIDLLARNQCRFPVGQHKGEHVFCADDVPEGLKYCMHHHARSYRGTTRA